MTFLRVFLAILTPLHSLTSLSLFLFIVLLIGFTVSNIKDIKVNMLVNIVKQFHSYPSIMKISIIFTLFVSGAIGTESYHLYSLERKHNMLVLCPSILMGTKCINCHIMHPISDGRPWNAYFNSKRGGFSGIRRRASC